MISNEWYERLDRIHSYPAKYPLRLALDYVEQYCPAGGTVYDPFVGSGTTLLSASMLGRPSIGTDINPIATLLSNFKITNFSLECLEELTHFTDELRFKKSDTHSLENVIQYPNIDHWFTTDALEAMSHIKQKIERCYSGGGSYSHKLFCDTVFSSILVNVSNQESDTRYAAKKMIWIMNPS